MRQYDHCSYCGAKFITDSWPRHCNECQQDAWRNPLPITVVLLGIQSSINSDRLLIIKRAIEPGIGGWALPGGYLDMGETWQEGAAREVKEETDISINPKQIELYRLITAPSNGNLLIFCHC